ncbi:hypothetical protein AMK59_1205, partial [Oryctes borbonicus]
QTELRYAWGSQALKPVNKEVSCPFLQPGEKGKICVLLEIPKIPGTYECYWHFYHEGRRFGHWLGCEIIVDGPPVKNVPFLPSPTYDVINIHDAYELVLPTSWTAHKKKEEETVDDNPENFVNPFKSIPSTTKCANCFTPNMVEETAATFAKITDTDDDKKQKNEVAEAPEEVKVDTNPFSDSDNQSIISISDSSVNSGTSEDFVLLKMSPKESEKDAPVEEDRNLSASEVRAPNLNSTNSSEVAEDIETIFSRLSLEKTLELANATAKSSELQVDCNASVGKEKSLVDVENLKEDGPINTQGVVQQIPIDLSKQIPIDLSNKSVANDVNGEINDAGYAYVHYKGCKIPISKKHLRPEFLVTAEVVPESELQNLDKLKIDDVEGEPVRDTNVTEAFRTSTPSFETNQISSQQPQQQQQQLEEVKTTCSTSDVPQSGYSFCSLSVNNGTDCASNCGMGTSMASSMNENRFFVFPQYYPGYEVVPPLGTSYIDPNAGGTLPFQPVYGYNTVGEVLVNDWTTGLNYTACVRYPNPPNQYYSPTGNSTANTSRGCSSIPNSNSGSPLNQSHPQSPREHCSYKAESPTNPCNGTGYCRFEQQSSVNVNVNAIDHQQHE